MVVGIDDKYPARLTDRVRQRSLDLKQQGKSYLVAADPLSDVSLFHGDTRSSPGVFSGRALGTVVDGSVKRQAEEIESKIAQRHRNWWEIPANSATVTVFAEIASVKSRVTHVDSIRARLEVSEHESVEFDSILSSLNSQGLIQLDSDGIISMTNVGIGVFKEINRELELGRSR